MIKKFKINIAESELSLIKTKIKSYPWSSQQDMDGWTHGTNKKYLKELCDYWIKDFNWKDYEKLINSQLELLPTEDQFAEHGGTFERPEGLY